MSRPTTQHKTRATRFPPISHSYRFARYLVDLSVSTQSVKIRPPRGTPRGTPRGRGIPRGTPRGTPTQASRLLSLLLNGSLIRGFFGVLFSLVAFFLHNYFALDRHCAFKEFQALALFGP